MKARAVAALAAVAAPAIGACGGARDGGPPTPAAVTAVTAAPGGRRPARAGRRPAAPVRLRTVARRRLPTPVQLPGLARLRDGTVLAVGGLDAADRSVDAIVRLSPGRARRVGRRPVAAHDIGAAAIGDVLYAFGGGTAAGPPAHVRT